MAALLQRGQRRGFSMKGEVDNGEMQLPDLRLVTVLPKAEWLRIQGSSTSNQYNNQKESTRDAAQQREAMHLCSKEMVKFWSNTISGQRQKKLEAKKIREAIEEEQRILTDIEEAKYQAQKRKEAIAKAKAQQYYQTDRVKRFHSALLLTEVLKERDAQVELMQRIQNNSKDVDKEFMARIKSQEDEALKVEQQKTLQNRLERQAVAGDLKHQMKEHELVRERKKLEDKKEGEEIHQLRELYLWEQSMEKQSQLQQKRNIMQSHLEHLSSKDIIKAIDAQKQEMEDEQRKCFVAAKQKIMQLRRNKEAELFREAQMLRDNIIDKLTATKQEQVVDEEQLIAKAIAEREAKQAQKQKEGDDTKAAMLKSITAHRELMRQEKEKNNLAEQQHSLDILQARKEADRLFFEKQQLKAKKKIEGERILQGHYVNQMAEKCAMGRKLRTEQQEFEAKNTDVVVEEEKQFRQYAKHVIKTAAEAKRNVLPLRKAAREGIGGGLGPIFGGVRPSYLVHDVTGVEMPTYICGTTQNIKDLHETSDIHEAKKRLGFTW